jgi:hypothetical protein
MVGISDGRRPLGRPPGVVVRTLKKGDGRVWSGIMWLKIGG